MNESTYEGGCHCGAVRFRVTLKPEERVASDCNCSICCKKGFLHLIVPPARFELLRGVDALTTYTFNTGVAQHHWEQNVATLPDVFPDCDSTSLEIG